MSSYELILIFDPNLGEEKIEGMVSKIEGKIKNLGGELEKTDKWGIRKLGSVMSGAKKLQEGYYVVIYFKAMTSLPRELQNYLKVTENVIRYIICRAVAKPLEEIAGTALESKEEIKAVDIGEIKEVGEALGES